MKLLRKYVYAFALLWTVCMAVHGAEELPVVDMTADRITIYPQRMELNGTETLWDILQMYPDMLTNAFESWLEGYSIRIDNGPYGGDMRMLLTKLPASRVMMVQISDNPGVAKATTGMNGVVDVFLLPMEKGSHGTISGEISTNLTATPFVEYRLGSASTDMLVNASYNYRHEKPYPKHQQYSNFHMTNQLGKADQLVTYFTQSYELQRNYLDTSRVDNGFFNSQLRHYHDFSDGTNLMTAIVYAHMYAPQRRFSLNDGHVISFMSSDWQGTVAAAQEVNRSFSFVNMKDVKSRLNLMAGWEVDYGMGLQREEDKESQLARRTLNYRVMNADAYFELAYEYKQWRFAFGDRVMYYRYRVDVPVGDRTHNDWRNMVHMSAIFSPNQEHHIQVGFFRKFYNPSYMGLFREAKGMTDEEWALAENNITETQLNEVKLGYSFARKNFSVGLNAYYYNVVKLYDFFQMDASAYYHHPWFSLSGGVHFYHSSAETYATFRVVPCVFLPYEMQLKGQVVVYTKTAPGRLANGSHPVYAALRYDKQLGRYVDLYVMWHDIFNGSAGIGLLGVQVNL